MAEKKYIIDNAELMAEWDWEKNTEFDPNQLTYGSNKKVWWKCSRGPMVRSDVPRKEQGLLALIAAKWRNRVFCNCADRAFCYGKTRFAILENQCLTFDHASILASALDTLRREGEKMKTVFAFLPEKFTLFALQEVQETLLGISRLIANFRRKIADFVEETDEYTEGASHRPARLFRKKTAS